MADIFMEKRPHCGLQLEIDYEDGTTETIVTDRSWKTSEGPIREADMLMGETYDARREMPGWDAPEFDDEQWDQAILAKENGSVKAAYSDKGGDREVELGFVKPKIVQAYASVSVRPIETICPIEITEPKTGVYIFNMGQNFSGIVELKMKGAPRGEQDHYPARRNAASRWSSHDGESSKGTRNRHLHTQGRRQGRSVASPVHIPRFPVRRSHGTPAETRFGYAHRHRYPFGNTAREFFRMFGPHGQPAVQQYRMDATVEFP